VVAFQEVSPSKLCISYHSIRATYPAHGNKISVSYVTCSFSICCILNCRRTLF